MRSFSNVPAICSHQSGIGSLASSLVFNCRTSASRAVTRCSNREDAIYLSRSLLSLGLQCSRGILRPQAWPASTGHARQESLASRVERFWVEDPERLPAEIGSDVSDGVAIAYLILLFGHIADVGHKERIVQQRQRVARR